MLEKGILVTGATGYIGCKVIHELKERGYKVHAVVRDASSTANLAKICIHQYESNFKSLNKIFKSCKIDYVIHLAAWSGFVHNSRDIDNILDSNIKFGTHLVQAMIENDCNKIINTGTFWQHNEDETYFPNSLYAASKQAFCAIIDYYSLHHSLSAITLKLFDVYGTGDSRGKIFSALEKAYKEGEPLEMTEGKQCLCLTYIDDAVDAYVAALDLLGKAGHKIYSVAKKAVPLRDIVQIYLQTSGREIDIKWGLKPYRKGQIMQPYIGDALPGWKQQVDLVEGIKKIIS